MIKCMFPRFLRINILIRLKLYNIAHAKATKKASTLMEFTQEFLHTGMFGSKYLLRCTFYSDHTIIHKNNPV